MLVAIVNVPITSTKTMPDGESSTATSLPLSARISGSCESETTEKLCEIDAEEEDVPSPHASDEDLFIVHRRLETATLRARVPRRCTARVERQGRKAMECWGLRVWQGRRARNSSNENPYEDDHDWLEEVW